MNVVAANTNTIAIMEHPITAALHGQYLNIVI
jgi:hypothetical protein